MSPSKIKSLLVEKGVSQTWLASHLGRTKQLVSAVISKKTKSRLVQQAIANAAGVSYDELWCDEEEHNEPVNFDEENYGVL